MNARIARGTLPFMWAVLALFTAALLLTPLLAQPGSELWHLCESSLRLWLLVAVGVAFAVLTNLSAITGRPTRSEILAGGAALAAIVAFTSLAVAIAVLATHASWSLRAYLVLAVAQVAGLCVSGFYTTVFHAVCGEPSVAQEPVEHA